MFDKKKLHFWQLFIIFASITIISLLYSWGSNSNIPVSMPMMQKSMGDMMQMHLKDVTIADLIRQEEQPNQASQSDNDMSSHHEEQELFLKMIHQLTTATIILLLPLIIAGSIFLAIIWVK